MGSTGQGKLRIAGGVLLWILTVFELLGMGLAGAAKFQGDGWQNMFLGWGYPAWLALAVGAVEVVGALLILVPRFATYAAAMLIVIMLGAVWTVASPGNETNLGPVLPAIHIVVLSIIRRARRGRRWRPS